MPLSDAKPAVSNALPWLWGWDAMPPKSIRCRIIDSPRERLIAILTNALVPCNGRFPTLFLMITLFFLTGAGSPASASFLSAMILTCAILAGVAATLGASWLLSHTLLKGVPSAFTLELPPYRRPQVRKVLIRSIFDRTLFVLGRGCHGSCTRWAADLDPC